MEWKTKQDKEENNIRRERERRKKPLNGQKGKSEL